MDKEKVLDKIKKCLALSKSSNEHEAAAALRQAKKLMEAHDITGLDMQASEAEERRAAASARTHPADWEALLAASVGWAFGCRVLFTSATIRRTGEWCFIGCGNAPEVAQYALTVLRRQAKRAREEHIKTRLKRCKVATKARRADLFSEGWVRAVAGKIAAFAGPAQQSAAIDAYMAKHYPRLGSLTTRNRNDGRKLRDHEYDDLDAGRRSGREAQLNHGVGGPEKRMALE